MWKISNRFLTIFGVPLNNHKVNDILVISAGNIYVTDIPEYTPFSPQTGSLTLIRDKLLLLYQFTIDLLV